MLKVQKKSGDSSSQTGAESAGGGGALRGQLRGMDYASGQAALSPSVQKKDGAKGKGKPPAPDETISGNLYAQDARGKNKPPAIEDVRQGSASDCYFFAAMCATVHANPALISNMLGDNGDGSYTVTFGIKEGAWSWAGGGERVTETIRLEYAKGENHGYVAKSKALWPLVIEKAWAKHKGGITNIEGGQAGQGVEVLTGKGLTRVGMSSTSASDVVTKAKEALDNKWILSLFGGQGDGTPAQQKLAKDIDGLFLGHAYAITDVNKASKQLKLHNPWGRKHPNGTGWVNAADAKVFFSEMHINK